MKSFLSKLWAKLPGCYYYTVCGNHFYNRRVHCIVILKQKFDVWGYMIQTNRPEWRNW